MLKSLRLTDFCSHKETYIEFTDGVNAITGYSDAGKSNIIYAIQWALFDSLPSKFSKAENLIRYGKKMCRVELWLEREGLQAVITRTRTPSGGQWKIETKDAHSNTSVEVAADIIDFLGLSPAAHLPSVWSRMVAINQFEVMDGFGETPSERKRIFDRVLGVNDFETTWKKLAESNREIEDMVTKCALAIASREPIAALLEVSRVELEKAEGKLNESRADLAPLNFDLMRLTYQFSAFQDKAMKYDELRGQHTKFVIDRGIAESQVERASVALEGTRDAQMWLLENSGKHANMLALEKVVEEQEEALREQYETAAQQETARNHIVNLTEKRACFLRLREYAEELYDPGIGINALRVEHQKLEEEYKLAVGSHVSAVAALAAQRDRATFVADHLRENYECPVCYYVLQDRQRENVIKFHEAMAEEAHDQTKAMTDLSVEIQKTEMDDVRGRISALERMEAQLIEADDYENQLLGVEEKLEEAREVLKIECDYEGLRELILANNGKLAAWKPFGSEYIQREVVAADYPQRQKELEWIQTSLEGVKAGMEKLGEQIEDLGFDKDDFARVHGKREGVVRRMAVLDGKIDLLESIAEGKRVAHDEAVTAHGEVLVLEAESDLLEKKYGRLSRIREVIRQAGPVVARNMVRRISHEANIMFSGAWQTHKDARLEWRDDYSVNLLVNDINQGYTTGGGMQVTAALAIRLAIVKELSEIGLLVADEVSMGALDPELRGVIPELMLDASNHGQVIVIDHGGLFDNVVSNEIKVRYDGHSVVG